MSNYKSTTEDLIAAVLSALDERLPEQEIVSLANETNQEAGTYDTGSKQLSGHKHLVIYGTVSGNVTVTIEASIDGDNWYDITKAAFDYVSGSKENASFIDTSFVADLDGLNAVYYRVKWVAADATNSTLLKAALY